MSEIRFLWTIEQVMGFRFDGTPPASQEDLGILFNISLLSSYKKYLINQYFNKSWTLRFKM